LKHRVTLAECSHRCPLSLALSLPVTFAITFDPIGDKVGERVGSEGVFRNPHPTIAIGPLLDCC